MDYPTLLQTGLPNRPASTHAFMIRGKRCL
jgi:hypothetical protein